MSNMYRTWHSIQTNEEDNSFILDNIHDQDEDIARRLIESYDRNFADPEPIVPQPESDYFWGSHMEWLKILEKAFLLVVYVSGIVIFGGIVVVLTPLVFLLKFLHGE